MERVIRLYVLAAIGLVFVLSVAMFSKDRRKNGVAFLLGWCVPGLGHLFLGRWKKAVFFFLTLGATYLFGLWLTGFRTVGFDDNPFYYVGQFGSGMTTLLASVLGKEKAFPRPDLSLGLYDPGLLYVCVAGLLNLVVAFNCFDFKGAPEAAPPAKEEAAK
ncbi:MAG: hypothetical protein HYY17_07925 [Planctomycetes bacterium]|nr:hypothetical protein [Planctomycetota bacterium]